MKVIIELVRKPLQEPYYSVSNEVTTAACFCFKDNEPSDSIWSQELAFKNAKTAALQLKESKPETREIIETL